MPNCTCSHRPDQHDGRDEEGGGCFGVCECKANQPDIEKATAITQAPRVAKTGGDYTFEGTIVADFRKRSGLRRFVVEDDRGLLFIFNTNQLTPRPAQEPVKPTDVVKVEAVIAAIRDYPVPSGISIAFMSFIKDELMQKVRGLGEK